jgi:hypothetical protein
VKEEGPSWKINKKWCCSHYASIGLLVRQPPKEGQFIQS